MGELLNSSSQQNLGSSRLVKLVLNLCGLIILGIFFYYGFRMMQKNASVDDVNIKLLLGLFSMVWGVGGIIALVYLLNNILELFTGRIKDYILAYIYVGPAIAMMFYYLTLPAFRSFWLSLFNRDGEIFIGIQNYITAFTSEIIQIGLRNNLLWILFGATLSVVFGLLIAVLADRSDFEKLAKSLIFMPRAISFVGAGVIWKYIYEFRDATVPQIGLLNAIVVAFGGEPQAWLTLIQPWNNLFLIFVVVWMQTGFAMVLFSSAIKGVPSELMEAARIDGANEFQVFFKIMLTSIAGTIIMVSTTIVIFTLKIFDVVFVMTGGQFKTQVIATQFYRELFINRNSGLGSAIAIILLIAVVPVIIYNLVKFSRSETF
ncbi:MAG: sugar ABC transporter permease [Anaerolineaceae bacterium]|nr:sugar ABC transporter permease [Anaerolineaceae bacterium]